MASENPQLSGWHGWADDDDDEILIQLHDWVEPKVRSGWRLGGWVKTLALISVAFAVAVGSVGGYLYWRARSALNELHAGAKQGIVSQAKLALNVAPSNPLAARLAKNPKRYYFLQNVSTGTTDGAGVSGAQTILMLGSDRRWGETGGRSDTIMLLRVLPGQNAISILSIPRDLRVPIPGHGYDKVNAAFSYGGDKLLIETLRDYFGITINHFIEVNFRGFQDIINSLHGVYIPVDQRYYNYNDGSAATDYANINLQPGYQLLNATNALAYVRYRHGDSDFYRTARQQLFLREVTRQVKADKYDFSRMSGLINAFAKATVSDINSIGEVWKLADTARQTPSDRVARLTVNADSLVLNGIDYLQASSQELDDSLAQWLHPDWKVKTQQQTVRLIKKHKSGAVTPASPTSDLVSDDGRAAQLFAPLGAGMKMCHPTMLPPGYYWPSSDGGRDYTLAGHPATAAYATSSSGNSILWMATTWQTPPILDSPTQSVYKDGRTYRLYFDSGVLRQVAWQIGATQMWVTNTLRNDLTSAEMMALATSCVS